MSLPTRDGSRFNAAITGYLRAPTVMATPAGMMRQETMMRAAPTIMVSSTFYDLRQIRTDLAKFIQEELGYLALLSEAPSFPIDPDQDTIDNCRARVRDNADILILIIGGRYGSIDMSTEKSITNLEFDTAKAKGIPIYIFVERTILAVLPIWETNPNADFSNTVDTPHLLRFVTDIRNDAKRWIFSFDTAQDIIATLRIQFAHLVYDALLVRRRLGGAGLPTYFETLGPKALRLLIEKGPYWEHKLFLQSWIEEAERRGDLLREHRAGLRTGPAESVTAGQAGDWLQTRIHELEGIANAAETLINDSLQTALGPAGTPGNPEHIVWVTRALGMLLDDAILWARRIRCARVAAPYEQVAKESARLADNLIDQLETTPVVFLSDFEAALGGAVSGERRILQLTLKITLANRDNLMTALANLHQKND